MVLGSNTMGEEVNRVKKRATGTKKAAKKKAGKKKAAKKKAGKKKATKKKAKKAAAKAVCCIGPLVRLR